jgi:hypothetical protein
MKVLIIAQYLFFGLGLFSLWLSLRYSSQMITTEALFLKDAHGTTRAYLGTVGNSTLFYLLDAEGKAQVALSADSAGPSFTLSDGETGKTRARIFTIPSGTLLSFHDPSGQTRVLLKSMKEKPEERKQEAALILYDKDGHALFTAPGLSCQSPSASSFAAKDLGSGRVVLVKA